MIVTIWTIQAKPGMMEDFKKAITEFDLRDRPAGCKEVLPLIDVSVEQLMAEPGRPDVVSILQRWNSMEYARTAGGGQKRMEFMNRFGQYIESASVRFFQTLDEE